MTRRQPLLVDLALVDQAVRTNGRITLPWTDNTWRDTMRAHDIADACRWRRQEPTCIEHPSGWIILLTPIVDEGVTI